MYGRRSERIVHGDVFRRLIVARDYIESSHASPLALDDIAARAGISPYHFLRLFRRAFGVTPHEYLVRTRIDRAKALLARSSASVTEVCLDVGYSSVGSFSTLFHREVGCSPLAWQRRVRSLVGVPARLHELVIPCCYLHLFGAAATG